MTLKKILSKALAVLMTAAIFASATPVLGYAANESDIVHASTAFYCAKLRADLTFYRFWYTICMLYHI